MRNVTLRQLRVFATAARHMNFSRAADELHLSQPAVSTVLKQLASQVGLPLFERIGRRTFLPPAGMDIVAVPFAPHPYVIVAAPSHPLAGARQIPRTALNRERFVMREPGSDTWNSMREVFGRQFGKLNIAMQTASTETIKQAVVAGMGIAFLSAHTIGLDLLAGNLVVLDVQDFPARLNWYLVHNRTKHLPPVAAAFKDFLLREGAALIERLVRFDWSAPSPRARPAPAPPPRRRARGPRTA